MKKLIIFDLDDTLYYEKQYVLGAFKDVAHYLSEKYCGNFNKLYERMIEILEYEGRGKIFNIICDENCFKEDIKNLIEIYRNSKPELFLYRDSLELLNWLRENNYKIGIITDGCSKVQWNKIESLKVNKLVDKIIVTDDMGRDFWKPNERSYIEMMNFFNFNSSECMYIGDNPNKDFIGAKKLGINTVRILRNQGEHISIILNSEYEADFNISDFMELKKYLLNY